MAEFFGFMKMLVGSGTVMFIVMLVLLSLPQSKLRLVGLEMCKYAMCVALVLMIPSPIDILPDAIPVLGWLDDIGYIVGAVTAFKSAAGDRERRKLIDDIELAELNARRNAANSVANEDADNDDTHTAQTTGEQEAPTTEEAIDVA